MRFIIADSRRRYGVVLLVLLAAVFAATSQRPSIPAAAPARPAVSPSPATSPSLPPYSVEACGKLHVPSHYYFYDPNKESAHAFGPPVVVTSGSGTYELWRTICGYYDAAAKQDVGGDWKILRGLIAVVDGTYPNQGWASHQWLAAARDFVQRVQWGTAELRHNVPQSDKYTLYMTDTTYHEPTVHDGWKVGGPPSDELFITVLRYDGTPVRLELRLPCHFQPRWTDPSMIPKDLG